MSLVATDAQNYSDIADAIRAKNGKATTYKPREMAPAILALTNSDSSEYALGIPALYKGLVDMARENYYIGEFAHVMIMMWQSATDATAAVLFLMDNFEILSFDPVTSEFTAIGWYSVYQNQSTGEWETADHRYTASTGGNYAKHIKFASCYIEYGGQTLFPVGVADEQGDEWEMVFNGSVQVLEKGYSYNNDNKLTHSNGGFKGLGAYPSGLDKFDLLDTMRLTVDGKSRIFTVGATIKTAYNYYNCNYIGNEWLLDSEEDTDYPDSLYDFCVMQEVDEITIMPNKFSTYFYSRTPGTYSVKIERLVN